ncbi:Hypothetical predicted protein [Paramuricea clavata]|uniref:Uncharacterized protein n=1 Tax=Paramuricea clavata TaxID=317549 RepID=A0A7D9EBU1_PARCT|nr:Hypothetical predicted protein [Paramuricea clavata]
MHRIYLLKFFPYSSPCKKNGQNKGRRMDLVFYTAIIAALCFVPPIATFIIGGMVWCCCRKGEGLTLIMMKSVISKKNIDKKAVYLVCDRKLPSSSRKYFMIYSLIILTICVQCFFLLAFFEVSFECKHDPDLDCFKEIDEVAFADVKLSSFDQSPVNCSTLSKDDHVFCYRTTAFDPEKAFFSAAAAYLLFEMLNIGLVVIAHIMLFLAEKLKSMLMIKIVLTLIFVGFFVGIFVLRTQVDDFESATRKLPYTVLVQGMLVLLFIFFYVVMLPWGKIGSEEYYGDASLPTIAGAHDNEMTDPK